MSVSETMTASGSVGAALAAAVVCFGTVAAGAEPAIPRASAVAKYRFLQDSKWYVPTATLPAIEFKLRNGVARSLIDQTVWDITSYRYGYFWGRSVAVFTRPGSGEPIAAPSCTRMVGSVTPSGRVHITFIGEDQNTVMGAVRGIGTLSGDDQQGWIFEMQMSTGSTSLIAHWSYMEQCKPGQQCEAQLPGSDLSLSDFLAQCD